MMSTVLESLLYRAEDPSVEFKSEQYPISQGTRDEGETPADAKRRFEAKKSELLKDVLAMANGWRDGPGYIVIGVRDIQGGVAEVVGLPADQLFDDAQLQQFINEKLAHPVHFTYAVFECEGKSVGLITVPKQKGRPFYAKKDFGTVLANTVYVRRGTSTAIANPTEIAKMGHDDVAVAKAVGVDFLVDDAHGKSLLNACHEITIRDFGDIRHIADYTESENGSFYVSITAANRHYWRQLATCLQTYSKMLPIRISLRSRSTHALRGCKLELVVTDGSDQRLELLEDSDLPKKPVRNRNTTLSPILPNFRHRNDSETMRISGNGTCIFGFQLLRSGETVASPELIFVRVSDTENVRLSFRLLSEDLSEPLEFVGSFNMKSTVEPWDEDKLISWADRRAEETDDA